MLCIYCLLSYQNLRNFFSDLLARFERYMCFMTSRKSGHSFFNQSEKSGEYPVMMLTRFFCRLFLNTSISFFQKTISIQFRMMYTKYIQWHYFLSSSKIKRLNFGNLCAAVRGSAFPIVPNSMEASDGYGAGNRYVGSPELTIKSMKHFVNQFIL